MLDWVTTVLTSEFVWGITFGILLSTLSAFATFHINKENQKRTIKRFLLDTVNNINSLSEDLNDTRSKHRVIDHEFLDLIDVEINIFGRNREHLSAIEIDDLRKNVREFVTKIASLVARTRISLRTFQENYVPENQINGSQRIEAEKKNARANNALQDAHASCDRLRELAVAKAPSLLAQLR